VGSPIFDQYARRLATPRPTLWCYAKSSQPWLFVVQGDDRASLTPFEAGICRDKPNTNTALPQIHTSSRKVTAVETEHSALSRGVEALFGVGPSTPKEGTRLVKSRVRTRVCSALLESLRASSTQDSICVTLGTRTVMSPASFKSAIVIVIVAVATVVGIDVEIRHLSPYSHAREAIDGLKDLENSDPTILVVGSSYARTFNVLGRELFKRSFGKQRLVDVPLEFGKLSSYAWMTDNRLVRLVDERKDDGSRKRPSLRRFVIVTEWWDSCLVDKPANIPGRLWTLDDFSGAVLSDGITPYSRNYLQYQWRRIFSSSALVQYRGAFGPMQIAFRRLLGKPVGPIHDPKVVANFYQEGIAGINCVGNPSEMAALEKLLTFATDRNLEPIVVLFPFMPSMQSPEARVSTYRAFFAMVQAIAQRHRARLVDLVTPSPLADDDWLPDCEHLNPAGNEKFASWTLGGPLSFLQDDPKTPSEKP
jgi:hypothetical protein